MSLAYPVGAQARASDRVDDSVEGMRRSACHLRAKRTTVVAAGQLLVTLSGVNRIGTV